MPVECAVLWGLLIIQSKLLPVQLSKRPCAGWRSLGHSKASQLHPFVLRPLQGPASMLQLKRYPLRWQSRCSSSTCWAQLP